MKRALFRLCVNGSIAVAAIGCGDQPTSPWPSPPARDSSGTRTLGPNPATSSRLQILSGNDQLTIPRGALPQPLVVRALDGSGRPRAGVLVRWQADGGSRFEIDTARTAPNGVASARWVLAASNGAYHATARLDTATAATFTARADSAAVQVVVVPDTIRFSSIGDTATVRIRITTNGSVAYAGIDNFGGYQASQSVVEFGQNPGQGLLLLALGNGSLTGSTWYGDVQLFLTVIVRQVPVGTSIVFMRRTSPRIDTLTIGPDDPTPLAVRAVDARGNPVADSSLIGGAVWQSSDSTIVAVTATGAAKGLRDGVATVTAEFSTRTVSTPFRVWTLEAADVVASTSQTCGRLVDGEIACWGYREFAGPLEETAVPTLQPVGAFTAFDINFTHACGLRDQAAYCWGWNNVGQLGTGTSGDTLLAPQAVSGGRRFSALRVNTANTCGLTTDGRAYCWGNGFDGILGIGSYGSQTCAGGWDCETAPAPVAGGLTFMQLSVGGDHSCALSGDGKAYCWGNNGAGQLGSPRRPCAGWSGGAPTDYLCSTVPVAVSGNLRFRWISAGSGYSCGVTLDGVAYCWGSNTMGQLGDSVSAGSYSPHESPTPVATNVLFTRVEANEWHTCAIATDGSAYCWGANPGGVLGNGVNGRSSACPNGWACDPTPVQVSGGLQFRSLALGFWHTCGLTTAGVLYCWGDDNSGAIGDGYVGRRTSPTRVLYQRR